MEFSRSSMYAFFCVSTLNNLSSAYYTRPLLEIEKRFDLCRAYSWHSINWTLCFPFIGVYMVAIFAGRAYMRSRPPFHLRGALLFWNFALAAFSTVCAWRLLSAVAYAWRSYGFLSTICRFQNLEQRQAVGFWMFLYLLSKIVEFGDTAFIVLRKSPLIFLHWYHHVTVTFLVWSTGAYASSIHIYFCTINVAVHSVMYSYYAVKGLNVHVPKAVSMVITLMQLVQMVAGMFITGYAYLAKSDPECGIPDQAIAIAASIYCSYFVLFLNFFFRTYVGKRARPGLKAQQNGLLKKSE